MKKPIALLLLISSASAVAADKKAPPPEPATQPDWAQVRRAAETLLTEGLYDPQAVQITWRGGWRWGHIKPFQLWSKREWGWLGCAGVNAKNRMGGYTGVEEKLVLLGTDGKMTAGYVNEYTSECDVGNAPVPTQAAFQVPTNGGVGAATAAAPQISLADELAKLADLKAKGILTEDEFQTQKAKLLAR